MEVVLAIVVGILFGCSVYLMLGRNLIKFLFGLILISNAANLAIFVAGRVTLGAPPLIPTGLDAPVGDVANALPQALILTAIVISFGLLAFALTLSLKAYQALGTVNTDEMRIAEPVDLLDDPRETSGEAAAAPGSGKVAGA